MPHGHILIDASSKLKLNQNVPGLCCLSPHGGGIKPGLVHLSITYFRTKQLAFNFHHKEFLRRYRAALLRYQKRLSSKILFLHLINAPILPIKRRAYVFVNTEAETRAPAVDVIKLIVALHSSAVKSSDIHAILECDTVVMFNDKQRCHHLTPLPKKHLSYSMSQDEQSITVASRALMPVASQESSCLSTFAAVVGVYTRVAGGRSGISKVIVPCNVDLYGVSCEADFYE